MRIPRIEWVLLCAILLFAGTVRVILIDRPFERDAEGCGSFYGLLARNYWRYDSSQSRGVPIQSMGVHANPTLYANHPPLVPLLISASFGIAGYRTYDQNFPPDWLVRLPTVPFTLGCIVLIWWLLRRDSPRGALLAACAFAAMPMTLIFGGLADVISPQLDFFVLLTVAAYLRFHKLPNLKNLGLLSLAFVPAALTDWPAFFLIVVLAAHFALTRPVRLWGWFAAFASFTAICFGVLYMQVVLATHDWNWMVGLVSRRALSNVADSHAKFSFVDWINRAIVEHAIGRHTWPVMLLACGWLVCRVVRRHDATRASRATVIVFAWAILHVLVGRQGVYVHQWWWWPLTPAVAMAAGLMIDRLWRPLDVRLNPKLANAVLGGVVLIFAAWQTRSALREIARPHPISSDPSLNYSLVEMGQAIREAAPPNATVMLAESDESMALWYYADRPLRRNVWDASTFERRLSDGSSDLLFGLSERSPQTAAAALIFPKAYRSEKVEPFIEYLVSRYPMRITPKFLVFDLGAK